MSVAADPLIGRLFDGRYRIVRKLGAGGMANVYLAEDEELGRRVAIKILNDRHAGDDQFVERFRREAQNAAGLSHPNIVSIYDRGEAEGTYYIAMEYLDGRSLKEIILREGPLPIATAVDYARQILDAIGFAHRHGIVHRDIKPHNVVVGRDGRVKVTDFGIARSGASQMTEAGSIIGTAQYLSPEQARGAPVDPTSDLYSLGVVLYETLTGEVPFTGETPLEIAMKHLSSVPEPPSQRRPEVPHDLDLVVLRALAKRPEDRYRTAEEMDADLAQIARGLHVAPATQEAATAVLAGAGTAVIGATALARAPLPAPPGPPYAPPPYYGYDVPPPRPRVWPWLLALGLLVALGVGAFFAYQRIQEELNANRPVAVPFVEALREPLAAAKIRAAGLKANARHVSNDHTAAGVVFDQNPAAGERIDKGNSVTIFVSSGKPRTSVPAVVGKAVADAVAALAEARLKPRVVEIDSGKPTGTVTGQDPAAGKSVVEGSAVRINVSRGPKPVAVPSVVGQPVQQASSALQGQGFAVATTTVDSTEPKGTVVATSPAGGTLQPAGTTITLSISKGPQTSAVPDVTSLDRASAISTLRNSGFGVKVQTQPTTDPAQDGIVLNQDPAPQAQAAPGATVTIDVGQYAGGPTTPTAPTTAPTTTAPATTAPATTAPTTTAPTTTGTTGATTTG